MTEEKTCENCEYRLVNSWEDPCNDCSRSPRVDDLVDMWEEEK